MMKPQILKINSQKIAYYRSVGTGPSVLLVHGNSSSGLSYRHQLESQLGNKYRLVAMDLPGHGLSEPASEPQSMYTLPGYTGIVISVIEQLGLTDGVFVGWSLGGNILLEASDQLSKAAGLMIIGTAPVGIPPALSEAFFPNPAVSFNFQAELSEEEMEAFAASFFKPNRADIPESFLTDIRHTDGRAREVVGSSLQLGGYRDEIEVVTNLSLPLAVVYGQQEQIINASYTRTRTLTMPTLWRSEVQIIPEAGHAPHWEQPEKFNALLETFIKDNMK